MNLPSMPGEFVPAWRHWEEMRGTIAAGIAVLVRDREDRWITFGVDADTAKFYRGYEVPPTGPGQLSYFIADRAEYEALAEHFRARGHRFMVTTGGPAFVVPFPYIGEN